MAKAERKRRRAPTSRRPMARAPSSSTAETHQTTIDSLAAQERMVFASEPAVHYMQADVSLHRVVEALRDRRQDLESEGAPEPDRSHVRLHDRVEHHGPI